MNINYASGGTFAIPSPAPFQGGAAMGAFATDGYGVTNAPVTERAKLSSRGQ